MERLSDMLIKQDAFSAIMMGNHALVRAMLEAEVKVVTTYPGSPTPEIADGINAIPEDKRPFYFEYSVNEKVATEIAFGASMNGHFSTVFFKSVGLNVASDSLVQLPLMELAGGMVVVLGDDPGVNSSQNEQDNRHFARMSYMPMFEPATPTETYQMYLQAAELAKKYRMPIFLRMTTHVCHAREKVEFNSLQISSPDWTPAFNASKEGPFIPITVTVHPMKKRALKKLATMEQEAETIDVNYVASPNGNGIRGVISASMPAMSLMENLDTTDAKVDLLKLGLSYPMPKNKVLEFLKSHDEVLIVEELDRVMEQEIKTLAYDNGLACKILAKPDTMLGGELDPATTYKLMADVWPDIFTKENTLIESESTIPRKPTFCPGCGHRAAFYAIKKVLPEAAITVADIGCHTMGSFEPYAVGETLLSMGHSNGTGAGFSIKNDSRKVITFIGDSTFFHAGMPGIVNAALYDHNLTLVVMENGTTAMTGQQPHPGSGEISDKISIDKVLEAFNVKFIKRVGAYSTDKLVAALEEAIEFKGFSVVIASHPCMLKFGRNLRRKKKDFPNIMTVDKNCSKEECAEIMKFDCPSFILEEDGSLSINPILCIGDGSCKSSSKTGKLGLKKRSEVK